MVLRVSSLRRPRLTVPVVRSVSGVWADGPLRCVSVRCARRASGRTTVTVSSGILGSSGQASVLGFHRPSTLPSSPLPIPSFSMQVAATAQREQREEDEGTTVMHEACVPALSTHRSE